MIGPAELATLRRAGLIPPDRYLEAVHLVRDDAYWARWAVRALLVVGVVHLLAGIFFFFAYNWAGIPPFGKFAVVEAGVLLCVAGAWVVGIDRAAGQSLLIGATVLTGVLLKVIGQVYQIDAVGYELFVAWTLLVLPWVLASRSVAHWLVWLVLACLAAELSAGQVLVPILARMGWIVRDHALLPSGLVLAAALLAREIAADRGAAWLAAWTRQIVLFAALAILFVLAFGFVFDWYDGPAGLAAFGLVAAGGALAYRWVRPDFAAVTQVTGFAGLLAMAVGVRSINAVVDFDDLEGLLFRLALVVVWLVAVTGSLAMLLPAIRRRMPEARR